MSDIDAPGFGGSREDSPMASSREPPGPINWNLLDAAQAAAEWRDLDAFVHWLKTTFGLSPAIVPPYWHRHDELIWELSALHTHFLACYDETSSPSAPIAWMRDFADVRHRLREWVAICGTRLDRDRPTRQMSGRVSQPSRQVAKSRSETVRRTSTRSYARTSCAEPTSNRSPGDS
jgi:hypothetical protein